MSTLTKEEAGTIIDKSFDRFTEQYYADNKDKIDRMVAQVAAEHASNAVEMVFFVRRFFAEVIETVSKMN